MKLFRAAVVAIILAGSVVLAPAEPVQACSCVRQTEAEAFERADAVFTGTVTARYDRDAGSQVISSADPIVWTFTVDGVAKGAVANPQQVVSVRSGPSCGFEFQVGGRYQVYARQIGASLETGLCAGTRQISGAALATAPPVETAAGAQGTGTEGGRAAPPAGQPEHRQRAGITAAIAALLVVAAGGTLATWRRQAAPDFEREES